MTGGPTNPQNGFALYIKMLMHNLQLPEAAFTYQSPGTCPRARHCQRQMGYTAENDCTKGTIPSRCWAPSFSPFLQFNSCTQNPAERPERSRNASVAVSRHQSEGRTAPSARRLTAEEHLGWRVSCCPALQRGETIEHLLIFCYQSNLAQ